MTSWCCSLQSSVLLVCSWRNLAWRWQVHCSEQHSHGAWFRCSYRGSSLKSAGMTRQGFFFKGSAETAPFRTACVAHALLQI
mmetsp:Transcript_31010/g.93823  ORF Transcript_31010/g.93823 Transcript_31010/m.93823 type:complete len:82 (+) Transcript_31010:206-451(+)